MSDNSVVVTKKKKKFKIIPTCKWFDFYFDFISNHVTYLEGNH